MIIKIFNRSCRFVIVTIVTVRDNNGGINIRNQSIKTQYQYQYIYNCQYYEMDVGYLRIAHRVPRIGYQGITIRCSGSSFYSL